MDFRMPELNNIVIAGRLIADAESRFLTNSNAVASFKIVVNKYRKDKDGNRTDKPCFIKVEAWGKTAEFCVNLKKGNAVAVIGELEQDEWDDKATGQKRTAHKITASRVQQMEWTDGKAGATPDAQPVAEDDIPF